ncbi:MAG TPA: PAS domain S-box protein, partial [Chromatiaceae bacterium]|nr:PAS domain S-box protein [Chromatiaceae bacterium]
MNVAHLTIDWGQFWDQTPDGIAMLDATGIVQSVNPAFERLTAFRSDELYGLKLHRLLTGFCWPAFLESGAPWHDEHARLRLKGGGELPVIVTVLPQREQGRLRGAVLTVCDPSSCQAQMERLKILSAAVEQSPNAVLITDLRGKIIYVNPSFTQLTGYSAEELIGQDPSILKSGNTPPETYRRLWSTIHKGGEWREVIQDRRKDGSLYWALESISPIRDSSGRMTHYLAIQKDITKQKQAEEAL